MWAWAVQTSILWDYDLKFTDTWLWLDFVCARAKVTNSWFESYDAFYGHLTSFKWTYSESSQNFEEVESYLATSYLIKKPKKPCSKCVNSSLKHPVYCIVLSRFFGFYNFWGPFNAARIGFMTEIWLISYIFIGLILDSLFINFLSISILWTNFKWRS